MGYICWCTNQITTSFLPDPALGQIQVWEIIGSDMIGALKDIAHWVQDRVYCENTIVHCITIQSGRGQVTVGCGKAAEDAVWHILCYRDTLWCGICDLIPHNFYNMSWQKNEFNFDTFDDHNDDSCQKLGGNLPQVEISLLLDYW